MAATCAMTPALSSAAPRPYRRSPRTRRLEGPESQSSSSPGGCTSWCAYSSTVGRPLRATRRASDGRLAELLALADRRRDGCRRLEEAEPAHERGDRLGAARHVLGVEGGPGDRRDAHEPGEVGDRGGSLQARASRSIVGWPDPSAGSRAGWTSGRVSVMRVILRRTVRRGLPVAKHPSTDTPDPRPATATRPPPPAARAPRPRRADQEAARKRPLVPNDRKEASARRVRSRPRQRERARLGMASARTSTSRSATAARRRSTCATTSTRASASVRS